MRPLLYKKPIALLAALLLLIQLTGCNMPAPQTPPLDLAGTSLAKTAAWEMTQVPIATLPAATSSPSVATLPPSPTPLEATATHSPTPEDQSCTNRASFVTDVTIPDGTEFGGGENFSKTWRLRNEGTCVWTTGYHLVFMAGDALGAETEIPLPTEVQPGDTIDLTVNMSAPESPGSYKGEWQLRDDEGEEFGIGEEGETSFWVQIVVTTEVEDLDLGAATWRDSFEGTPYWYMVDTDETRFKVEDGQLVMESINAGGYDEWGLSSRTEAGDFYIEVTATIGDECAGKDSFGLLFRAQDPNQTYVFGFACDGSYRLYKWDEDEYTGLVEWKSSPHIMTGPNQTNRLGLLAEGETFKLYANGKVLGTASDDQFERGRFGLFIGSRTTDHFKVSVEEVAYWDLSD